MIQAIEPINVTKTTPCAGVFAIEAIVERNLRICGEVARALPVTTINAICIPKPSKFQKPLPHILTKSTGVLSVNPQAQMNVTKVSNTAKISGSGRYLLTNVVIKRETRLIIIKVLSG